MQIILICWLVVQWLALSPRSSRKVLVVKQLVGSSLFELNLHRCFMNISLNCYLSLCATPAMDLDHVYLCNVVSTSHMEGNKYMNTNT